MTSTSFPSALLFQNFSSNNNNAKVGRFADDVPALFTHITQILLNG